MTTRTIAHIEAASNESVGPFKIKNVLPTRNLKQVDPYILIHHMQPFELAAGADARIPPHPHAGFEVVTYLLDGEFFHRDSKGHNQIANAGDVNWMRSGSGIVHSEGPAASFVKTGGRVQLLQIWINLPGAAKKQEPGFTHYSSGSFPVLETEAYWMKLLIGEFGGKQSPIETVTPMFLYHLKVKQGAQVLMPVAANHSSAIYIMQGKLKVLNKEPVTGELLDFHLDGDQLSFSAITDTEILVLGGEPLKEKLVSYGPFVMNSFEEIQESIQQYESGKMGSLDF